MDPIIEAATKKRDDLLKDLEKINHFLETYHTLALELRLDEANKTGTLSPFAGGEIAVDHERTETARGPEAADEPPPKRVRVSDNPSPAVVVEAAVKVIREKGRPMSRRAIHKALADMDIVVKGADPVKALGTMLWRSGKADLVQIEGVGYGLKDVAYDLENLKPTRSRLVNPG